MVAMKIAGDTHTHTLICQHAFSTLLENIRAAAAKGHRFLATTEHGPAMPGAPFVWFFDSLPNAVPREVEGVVVIRGARPTSPTFRGRWTSRRGA